MAKKTGVWGIDIGQCALKALYCTMQDGEMVAEAFDYIEYPKILSQPEADAEELLEEALQQFLSRNEVKGSTLAISVPGQSGLARFFKPPPVDAKKIPEIVRYEAKQQIPFDLEEVIWDFQKMSGGQEVDGFALDAEVGLFAMKREQVYKAIQPFADNDLELDIIQLAPLSIYNFVAHDLMQDGPAEDEYDPDDPPESLVVLSMGTETTDLVVTNGFRVWQRSIPIGGNHFTKQLTKELKLTFAKAEHLKRNARQAEDPKTVFQAMRPVFNDLVTEIQRSIGYFQGIDRQAKIRGVVILGNTVKLPGLQHYLSKNLGYDVVDFRKFDTLSGDSVLSAPPFKDNVLGFGVCYGLCLQGLGQARLRTNLVPREIIVNRLVRQKKPWAIAGVASLMMACAVQYFFPTSHWHHVMEANQNNGVSWSAAHQNVSSVQNLSTGYVSQDGERLNKIKQLTALGEEVVGSSDRRLLWLEFLHALNAALDSARTDNVAPGAIPDIKEVGYHERKEMFISSMESAYFTDLSEWFTDPVKRKYHQAKERGSSGAAATATPAPAAPEAADPSDPKAADPKAGDPAQPDPKAAEAPPTGEAQPPTGQPASPTGQPASPTGLPTDGTGGGEGGEDAGPTGSGWVIELDGYHLFNKIKRKAGDAHVNETLIEFLTNGKIRLPIKPGSTETEEFSMKDLGIGYAIIASQNEIDFSNKLPNPDYEGDPVNLGGGAEGGGEGEGEAPPDGGADGGLGGGIGPGGPPGGAGGGLGGPGVGGPPGMNEGGGGGGRRLTGVDPDSFVEVPKYSFTIQFCWQEQLLTQRLEKIRQQRLELQKQQDELKAQKEAEEKAAGTNTTTGGAE